MHDTSEHAFERPMHPGGTTDPAEVWERIANALAAPGWCVIPDALPPTLTRPLAAAARDTARYHPAGVGRQAEQKLNPFVRRDRIAWIEPTDPAAGAWLAWADSLRTHLNRSLMTGLVAFESHFACYPPGTFYRRHVDAFRGAGNRAVSVVAYLNDAWLPGDGGELVLYDGAGSELGRFPPVLGTIAVYQSERFPHEVLPVHRTRYSVAGWFRCRAELPLENF